MLLHFQCSRSLYHSSVKALSMAKAVFDQWCCWDQRRRASRLTSHFWYLFVTISYYVSFLVIFRCLLWTFSILMAAEYFVGVANFEGSDSSLCFLSCSRSYRQTFLFESGPLALAGQWLGYFPMLLHPSLKSIRSTARSQTWILNPPSVILASASLDFSSFCATTGLRQ